jgi:hypothetical protein
VASACPKTSKEGYGKDSAEDVARAGSNAMFKRTTLRPIAIPFHSIGFALALKLVISDEHLKDLNGTAGFKRSHMAVEVATVPNAIGRISGSGIHASSSAFLETGN